MNRFFKKDRSSVTLSTIPTLEEGDTDQTATTYGISDVWNTWAMDYTFTCTCKMTDETKTYVLGFKSVAAMNRFYRRIKRKKEQERRRRLKDGNS